MCRDMHGCDGEVPGSRRGTEKGGYLDPVMKFGGTTQQLTNFVTLGEVIWYLVKVFTFSMRKSRQMTFTVTFVLFYL